MGLSGCEAKRGVGMKALSRIVAFVIVAAHQAAAMLKPTCDCTHRCNQVRHCPLRKGKR